MTKLEEIRAHRARAQKYGVLLKLTPEEVDYLLTLVDATDGMAGFLEQIVHEDRHAGYVEEAKKLVAAYNAAKEGK